MDIFIISTLSSTNTFYIHLFVTQPLRFQRLIIESVSVYVSGFTSRFRHHLSIGFYLNNFVGPPFSLSFVNSLIWN